MYIIILLIVIACIFARYGVFYFNRQKQEKPRQREEDHYAQLLLKYTRILFYPSLAQKAQQPEKKEVPAQGKTEPHTPAEQLEVQPEVYRRLEKLFDAKRLSPGYVKGLATLFQFSMEMCENLTLKNSEDFTDAFFSEQTKLLLQNYSASGKESVNPSGFTPEENSLRREICGITDEKVSRAFYGLSTGIKDDKTKDAMVKYLAAYLLVTRAPSRIAAEIPVFLNVVPYQTLLGALFQLVTETGGEQAYLYFCQEMVNNCGEKECVVWALKNAGDLYRREKRTAEAIEVYRTIVQRYPAEKESVVAQEKIIEIYSQDWRLYSNAIKECVQLIKLFPKSESAVKARFTVGQLYYQANDYQKALTAFQEFLRYYPKSKQAPEAYLFIALCHISRQDNDKAIKQLQYVVSKYKEHELAPRAQFLIGYCYLSRQKYYEARREYQRLVDLFPDSPYTKRAKDFVERLGKVKTR
ncbi:MAG: tetratricopeptide repeat protein [Smithellaceae bacterium]|nr:tetratricopeptide repeat protein [Smithellaceae bacterium]